MPSLSATLPEPRPILDLMAEVSPLKLLLPWDLTPASSLLVLLLLATSSRVMVARQNGQAGGCRACRVVGLGLLWQHSASVHAAHIWCPQSCTSMLQADAAQLVKAAAAAGGCGAVVIVISRRGGGVGYGCGCGAPDVSVGNDLLLPLPVGFHQSRLQEGLGLRVELADELERGRPHHGLRRRRVQQGGARSVAAPEGQRVGDPPCGCARSAPQARSSRTQSRLPRRAARCSAVLPGKP